MHNVGDHTARHGHAPVDLMGLAWRAMRERGLEPDFGPDVRRQVDALHGPATGSEDESIRDLRTLPWASIDNDDSRDLDQLSVAQPLDNNDVRVLVAIADVDALAPKDSPIDRRAQQNTTSVYTGVHVFPMLPERLSTDLTSLNPGEDRLAIVIAYVVKENGTLGATEIFRARVHNWAKLAYNAVTAWLEGDGPMPDAMAAAPDVPEQIRLQDEVAHRLRARREERGALDLETIEGKAVVKDGVVKDLQYERQNRAQKLIEDFMIAANGVAATFLEQRQFPTLRRVVRTPQRWDRLVELAAGYHFTLPPDPDVRALAHFLNVRRDTDPLRFPDLSLAVVKMMGAGEYAVQLPGEAPIGHFGLAVRDYSHSTAPNRRYPDLITQRLIKAALKHAPPPYTTDELIELARHCTLQEDAANKVERQIRKSAAATLLLNRLGEKFDAIVTGASPKGVWVRTLAMPVEGRLTSQHRRVDVGDRLRVELVNVDVERGFIDFAG